MSFLAGNSPYADENQVPEHRTRAEGKLKPKVALKQFRAACRNRGRKPVQVYFKARQTSVSDFQIAQERQQLEIIGDERDFKISQLKSSLMKNNLPDLGNSVTTAGKTVYESGFKIKSIKKNGYMAFLFLEERQTWLLKSFKKNK